MKHCLEPFSTFISGSASGLSVLLSECAAGKGKGLCLGSVEAWGRGPGALSPRLRRCVLHEEAARAEARADHPERARSRLRLYGTFQILYSSQQQVIFVRSEFAQKHTGRPWTHPCSGWVGAWMTETTLLTTVTHPGKTQRGLFRNPRTRWSRLNIPDVIKLINFSDEDSKAEKSQPTHLNSSVCSWPWPETPCPRLPSASGLFPCTPGFWLWRLNPRAESDSSTCFQITVLLWMSCQQGWPQAQVQGPTHPPARPLAPGPMACPYNPLLALLMDSKCRWGFPSWNSSIKSSLRPPSLRSEAPQPPLQERHRRGRCERPQDFSSTFQQQKPGSFILIKSELGTMPATQLF